MEVIASLHKPSKIQTRYKVGYFKPSCNLQDIIWSARFLLIYTQTKF